MSASLEESLGATAIGHRRKLIGDWLELRASLREYWQHLTDEDVASIAGERDALMRTLKARYAKTYGEIEREVTEFELRDARSANALRPSLGIRNDR
jgi:hypothetical protein